MSLDFLDPYVENGSRLHGLDARVKLVVALCAILAISLTPARAWAAHLGYLALILLAIALARLNLRGVLARTLVGLPFLLVAALGAPFWRGGVPLYSLRLFGVNLALTSEGAWRLASVVVKGWLSILAAATLAQTTHFTALGRALRGLGLPPVLSSIILLMYRYLFVLVGEAFRLMRAREARTATPDGRAPRVSLAWRAGVTGSMVGTLFLRTHERGERIYQAMLARGFDGDMPQLQSDALTGGQVAGAGVVVTLLALITAGANVAAHGLGS